MKKYLTLTVIVALGMVTEGFDIPKQYIDGVNRSFDIYMEEVLSPYGHSGWITEETMPYLKGERIKSHKNFVKSQLDAVRQKWQQMIFLNGIVLLVQLCPTVVREL